MTKQELLEIPETARRIEHERAKVEAMKARLYSPRGLDTDEKVQRSGGVDPALADVVIDAEAELRSQEEALQEKCGRARAFIIEKLEGEERQIMLLRYVHALKWETVARVMAYSAPTIYRRTELILEKLFGG